MAFRKGGPYSLWWPLSFLICWVVFCAVGGGLIGGSFNDGTVTYCYEEGACDDGPDQGMLIAGYAFVSLGGVSASIFWILLIIWLVKRSHMNSPHNAYYANNNPHQQYQHPMAYGQQYPQQTWQQGQHPQQPYGAPQYGQQYGYGPAPQQQQQYRSDPSSPPAAAMASPQSPNNFPPSSSPASHPSAALQPQDKKACGSCGAPVTTPFCAQCGAKGA